MPRRTPSGKAPRERNPTGQVNSAGLVANDALSPEVAEQGELPEGWAHLRLGEVATNSRGSRTMETASSAGIPFIPMALLPHDGSVTTQWELRKPEEVRSGVPFTDGDVLLAKITPCLENGKLGIARDVPGGWGMTSTEVYPLRPVKVTAEFLAACLTQPAVRRALASKMQGATGRQRLPKEALDSFPIIAPPLSEQRAIAEVLRTVQRAKEATEKVIAATRQLKASLMNHLFTYGPVPSAQADRVALRPTDSGDIPGAWPVSRLSECAHVQTGLAKGRRLDDRDAIQLPYLRVANVQDGRLDLTEIKTIQLRKKEAERFLLRRDDVVLTEGGDFDKLGRGFIWRGQLSPCVHQNHVFAVRADQSELLPEFLAYLAQSSYGKAYFLSVAHKTTNLACINATKLKAFPVVLPSLPEQRAICAKLSAVDAKLAAEEKRRASLDTLFKSLLDHLMTGNLRLPQFRGGVT